MSDCMEKLCCIQTALVDMLCEHISEQGIESLDTAEAGEVVDMIKDICDAKYHVAVTEAMGDGTVSTGYIYEPQQDERPLQHKTDSFDEAVETVRHIWSDADPVLRAKIKTQLSTLIDEMA